MNNRSNASKWFSRQNKSPDTPNRFQGDTGTRSRRTLYRSATTPMFQWDEQMPRIYQEFADYLRGKRVAMVGKGAPEHERQGDFIDLFDVVVRVHWPIPYHADIKPGDRSEDKPGLKWDPPPFVPEKWQPIVGKKTHIFYTSLHGGDRNWCKSIVDAFAADGGKFICEVHPGIMPRPPEGKLMEHYPVRQLVPELYYHLRQSIVSEPFGGTIAIADICRHEVTEVYLTGFSCFISDEHPTGTTDNPHVVPLNDFRWLRNFVRQHPDRIKIDDFMTYAFNKY